MAEVAARREARRRRILENADSRLKKISSIHQNLDLNEEDGERRNKENLVMNGDVVRERDCFEEVEKKIYEDEQKKMLEELNEFKDDCCSMFSEAREALPDETNFIDEEQAFITQTIEAPLKPETTAYTTLIILLLGISVRYVNLIFDKFEDLVGINLTFLHIDKIFTPLIGYEIYMFLFGRVFYQETTTMNLLLALNNVDAKKLRPVLRFVNVVVGVLNDMAIYFFAFIILDLIFAIFNV